MSTSSRCWRTCVDAPRHEAYLRRRHSHGWVPVLRTTAAATTPRESMSCWPRASAVADCDPFRHWPYCRCSIHHRDHYEACTDLFAGLRLAGRRLLLPATVSAEAGYLIDRLGGPEREAGFLEGISEGAFEPVDLTSADYARMAQLVEQYADMDLGTTDASVIALAERLGGTRRRPDRRPPGRSSGGKGDTQLALGADLAVIPRARNPRSPFDAGAADRSPLPGRVSPPPLGSRCSSVVAAGARSELVRFTSEGM